MGSNCAPWWSLCILYLSHARWSYRRRLGSLLLWVCIQCAMSVIRAQLLPIVCWNYVCWFVLLKVFSNLFIIRQKHVHVFTFFCLLVLFVLQSWLLLLPFVTLSHKTDLKSIVSLLRYWHGKEGHKMRLHLLFGSSPYLNRQKSYSQLYCGSQVKDTVIVPHFFACGSYRPQRLNTIFVQSLSHFVRFSSRWT